MPSNYGNGTYVALNRCCQLLVDSCWLPSNSDTD